VKEQIVQGRVGWVATAPEDRGEVARGDVEGENLVFDEAMVSQ
jgi:hypothetical protein